DGYWQGFDRFGNQLAGWIDVRTGALLTVYPLFAEPVRAVVGNAYLTPDAAVSQMDAEVASRRLTEVGSKQALIAAAAAEEQRRVEAAAEVGAGDAVARWTALVEKFGE